MMISCVADLVKRLKQEAIELDDVGCSDAVSGIHAAIRVIADELSLDDAIGLNDEITPTEQSQVDLTKVQKLLLSKEILFQQQTEQAITKAAISLDYQKQVDELSQLKQQVVNLPCCPECGGVGTVKPLKMIWECFKCHGTGRDFGDIENLIIHQQAIINNQQIMLNKLSTTIYDLKLAPPPLTEQERLAISVNEFYKGCKYWGD